MKANESNFRFQNETITVCIVKLQYIQQRLFENVM